MKRMEKLGLPYMGSKRKLSKKLVNFMLNENKNAKYFYDVFGGGGAMSFEAMQRPQIKKVFYNELNAGVVELLKKIWKDGVTKEFYKWIDRDTFKKHKDDDTWYGGMIATCWSFGNNKDKGYLFSKDIEEDKRLLHEIVVSKCEKSLLEFNKKFELNIEMNFGMFDENIAQRRTRIAREVVSINNSRDGELQRLQQLQISNTSYEQLEISTPANKTIIYLDPPYEDTEKYSKGICHKEFYKWVDTLTERGYKVYISSYRSHLPCVLELKTLLLIKCDINKRCS